MPLYDYQCEQCHRHTEKIQKFSDAPLTECPHCGGKLERVLHAPAVAFKGGGWYADGYGNKKSGGSGADKGGDSKPAEAKSEGKNDSGSKSSESSSASTRDSASSSSVSTSSPAASSAPAAPTASNSGNK
ncbi:MAG TPA: zinc ribbon domain-containing protein [Acidobacteriaceae bacterium]|nr:zinc ribbon domain-containing protein [Acidobacteriaceae bacterium]